MTDYTATAAANGKAIGGEGGGADELVICNTISPVSPLLALDRILMARLPKGAVITGGRLFGGNLDSTGSGSALLNLNVGVDMGGTFNSNQLGAFGVLSSAAITGVKPEVGYEYPLGGLLRTVGPQTMTGDYNNVYITCVASAAGQTAGVLGLEVRYRIGAHS